MLRRLTIWIACLTVAMLTMAMVLASAAHAQATVEAAARDVTVDSDPAPLYGALLLPAGARLPPASRRAS